MRIIFGIISAFVIVSAVLLIAGCSQGTPEPGPRASAPMPSRAEIEASTSCSRDVDCICGGIDTFTGKCFLGNRGYHDKYVDDSQDCPDFCTGMSGNLIMRCVNSECMQTYECLSDSDCGVGKRCKGNSCVLSLQVSECKTDADCTRSGCSGNLCTASSGKDDGIATTCEFLPEYECLSMVSCGCDDGSCGWSSSPDYERCVADARESMLPPPDLRN
ncbi:MAG: eight-cysteine-cluster domain-containing protein [Candidatus Woesearchaeota archaeon]